jgi:glycosyltransferase involved in cell wall biosynthesis
MTPNNPLVAIQCLVYNHEPYLRDCLEGFVMQQTNFPFVAIVHDDASTDGSAAIIREYEGKYPNIIKPIYEIENQYSKRDGSVGRIMDEAIDATGAKYVAMCEGDDYWTDPLKLQKQVDFMEENPEYVLCCHRYKIYNQNDGTWSDDYVKNMFELAPNGFSFTNKENLSHWATKTMTLLFRRAAMDKMPTRKIFRYWRDVHLNYYLLKEGPGYCFPFVGAVARRHSGGVFSSIGAMNQWRINLKVWNELLCQNREDEVLLAFYQKQHNAYRDYIVSNIFHQRKNEIVLDIKTLLMLDIEYGGIKSVIFSIKQMILALKSLTKKKIKKCINHFFQY